MEIKINGIKCDACDYSNDDADWGTTPEEIKATSEAYIAMPCPKCGASLLTQEDHDALMGMLDLQPLITELEDDMYPDGVPAEEALQPLITELEDDMYPDGVPAEEAVQVKLDMDGSGKIAFRVE